MLTSSLGNKRKANEVSDGEAEDVGSPDDEASDADYEEQPQQVMPPTPKKKKQSLKSLKDRVRK